MKTYLCFGTSVLCALIGSISGLALPMIPAPVPDWATNTTPSVRIVTPGDGSIFVAPSDITVCATAAHFTDAVASVEFFAGTNSIGVATNNPGHPDSGGSWWPPFSDFCIAWTNVGPGDYVLLAIATDATGNTATSAPVDISVVTNLPPRVCITKPHNDENILGPTNIEVCATAFQPDRGTVTQVEFFAGTNTLGVVSNSVIYVTNRFGVFPIENTSYCLTWNDAQLGTYTLTAVATDNDGTASTSQPVDISVVSNLPPHVRIDSPRDGEIYFAPATVEICAAAHDRSGSIASVELFSGTNSLAVVTNGVVVTNFEGRVHEQFCFSWDGVAVGDYTLTALATASDGTTATSAPVSISVTVPPPPSVTVHTDGRRFEAPANVWICAVDRHFPDPVTSVQYFAGTNSIGIATNAPFFCFHWTGVPVGEYSITATATDVPGTNVVTSSPVDIIVRTNTPRSWGR
jgi:hypothetical protein